MKKRILALLCTLALCAGLAGCGSTAKTVGSIGSVEISAGTYLLSQYQGYYAALTQAESQPVPEGQTLPDYAGMEPKNFLAQTITVTDADTGEATTMPAEELVTRETLLSLQYYAAINELFTQLDGKLDTDILAQADADAKSIWEANQPLYEKNGFTLDTVKEYEYTLYKADALLELIYGKNGTEPVSDAALEQFVRQELLYVHYTMVPLYDFETFGMADEDMAAAADQCRAILDGLTAAGSTRYADFEAALAEGLPAVYETIGNEFTAADLMTSREFMDEAVLTGYYSEESAAALRALAIGEGYVALDMGYAAELFQRADPLAENTLDELRPEVLYYMQSQTLVQKLVDYGAGMANNLNLDAVQKLPAKNVVLTLE